MSTASADKSIVARELAASIALNRGLLEDFNPTWRDDAGRNLLHHAVLRNDAELVQDMLIAGVSVFEADRVGSTALHLAVLQPGSERIVDMLLTEGARPDTARLDGLTALHEACWCGNLSAVKRFLPMLPDLNLLDGNGRTPRDIAVEYDKPDVVAAIDREVYLRQQEELKDVTKKTSAEWSAVLKSRPRK